MSGAAGAATATGGTSAAAGGGTTGAAGGTTGAGGGTTGAGGGTTGAGGVAAAEAATKPLRSDAARNRKRLLEAAVEVLSEQGLDAGVEEIARRAGVGVGTLYRRFPDKDALITELILSMLEDLDTVAAAALAVGDGSGLATFLAASACSFVGHHGYLPRVWNDHRTEAAVAIVTSINRRIGLLLIDAREHGTVADWVTHGDVMTVLWGLRGVVQVTGQIAPDAWRRHLDLQLAALRTPGAPSAHPGLTAAELAAVQETNAKQ